MSQTPIDLSLVMVTVNNRPLLEECLESLRRLPDAIRWELILTDNGSMDGSPELAERMLPQVRLIRNDSNAGFARASNQGLALAEGRYVMLLNDDTIVQPLALQRLVEFMDGHPSVGACGPRLRYPDGRHQPSCFTFHSPWRHLCEMLSLGRLFPRSRLFADQSQWFDHERTAPADWVMGAALLVRREVLEAIGPMDERFRINCNEVDWCLRIRRAGWEIFFVHDALILHYCGSTIRSPANRFRSQGEVLRNTFDYYHKHFGTAGLLWYRLWTVVGFAWRSVVYRLLNTVRPSDRREVSVRLAQGMVMAGLSGDPQQFSASPVAIG